MMQIVTFCICWGSYPSTFSIADYLAERELPFYDVSSFSEACYQPKKTHLILSHLKWNMAV